MNPLSLRSSAVNTGHLSSPASLDWKINAIRCLLENTPGVFSDSFIWRAHLRIDLLDLSLEEINAQLEVVEAYLFSPAGGTDPLRGLLGAFRELLVEEQRAGGAAGAGMPDQARLDRVIGEVRPDFELIQQLVEFEDWAGLSQIFSGPADLKRLAGCLSLLDSLIERLPQAFTVSPTARRVIADLADDYRNGLQQSPAGQTGRPSPAADRNAGSSSGHGSSAPPAPPSWHDRLLDLVNQDQTSQLADLDSEMWDRANLYRFRSIPQVGGRSQAGSDSSRLLCSPEHRVRRVILERALEGSSGPDLKGALEGLACFLEKREGDEVAAAAELLSLCQRHREAPSGQRPDQVAQALVLGVQKAVQDLPRDDLNRKLANPEEALRRLCDSELMIEVLHVLLPELPEAWFDHMVKEARQATEALLSRLTQYAAGLPEERVCEVAHLLQAAAGMAGNSELPIEAKGPRIAVPGLHCEVPLSGRLALLASEFHAGSMASLLSRKNEIELGQAQKASGRSSSSAVVEFGNVMRVARERLASLAANLQSRQLARSNPSAAQRAQWAQEKKELFDRVRLARVDGKRLSLDARSKSCVEIEQWHRCVDFEQRPFFAIDPVMTIGNWNSEDAICVEPVEGSNGTRLRCMIAVSRHDENRVYFRGDSTDRTVQLPVEGELHELRYGHPDLRRETFEQPTKHWSEEQLLRYQRIRALREFSDRAHVVRGTSDPELIQGKISAISMSQVVGVRAGECLGEFESWVGVFEIDVRTLDLHAASFGPGIVRRVLPLPLPHFEAGQGSTALQQLRTLFETHWKQTKKAPKHAVGSQCIDKTFSGESFVTTVTELFYNTLFAKLYLPERLEPGRLRRSIEAERWGRKAADHRGILIKIFKTKGLDKEVLAGSIKDPRDQAAVIEALGYTEWPLECVTSPRGQDPRSAR